MTTITEFYVDPSLTDDTGSGTIGDPYGNIEYCMEQEDYPAAGCRVNMKAGATDVIAAKLETAMADTSAPGKSVAWVPTNEAPLIIQGYTTAAGDGGMGDISCGGGAHSIFQDASRDCVWLRYMKLHDSTNNFLLNLNNNCGFEYCEVYDCVSGIVPDTSATIRFNYVHDYTGTGIAPSITFITYGNYVDGTGTGNSSTTVGIVGAGYNAYNIVICDQGYGFSVSTGAHIVNNAVYATGASTNDGIRVGSNHEAYVIANNLIEGFSGVGGAGIDFNTGAGMYQCYGNSFYDCDTNIKAENGLEAWLEENNETLSVSPFADAANGDFAGVDTGSVKEGSIPQLIGGGLV